MPDKLTVNHIKVMKQTMNYMLHTRERGLRLSSEMNITNPLTDLFVIKGRSDSNSVTNIETRKSVSGIEVTLNGALVVMQSMGQKIIALLSTKVELIGLA